MCVSSNSLQAELSESTIGTSESRTTSVHRSISQNSSRLLATRVAAGAANITGLVGCVRAAALILDMFDHS